ncbi:hypothetical protein H0H92_010541 [Tricholoma furcatifolium]|nr:hypothetical protein H0H92_010541 [Tricholoma furcatifolium]
MSRVYGYIYSPKALNEAGLKMNLGKVGNASLSTAVVCLLRKEVKLNVRPVFIMLGDEGYVCMAVASNDPFLYLPENQALEVLEKFEKGLGQEEDPQ